MKKKILYTLLIILAVFVTYAAYVINNPVSPLETVSSDDSDVSITYSRPFKNDRLIFGNASDEALIPYDNYWRTGANRHTYIENNRDLSIDGNTLLPGKYSIYTIPGENEWEVFFNSNVKYFGVSRPNESDDILSVKVPVVKLLMRLSNLQLNLKMIQFLTTYH